MAYIDYGFYVCTYFGDVVPEFDFLRLAELASDYLDTITFDRLTSGLPENERSKVKVQKAVCAMCEALYQIETAQKNAIAAAGGSSEAVSGGEHTTGIITGKSSGSESITYASPSEMARSASAWSAAYGAAGDPKKTNAMLYAVALPYLSGVCNDEGICLLYAGVF